MLNIEHLFENVLTCLDTGGDLLALERHPTTRAILRGVHATFDELVEIARYVKSAYCADCPLRCE